MSTYTDEIKSVPNHPTKTHGETRMEIEDDLVEDVQDFLLEECSASVEEKVSKTMMDVISEGETLTNFFTSMIIPMWDATNKVLTDSVREQKQVSHKLFIAALEDSIFTDELRNMVLFRLKNGEDAPHFEPLYDALTSAIDRQRKKRWIY
jgi:hypothetical protein